MASGGNVAVTKKLTPPERREGAGFTIKDLMSGLSDAEKDPFLIWHELPRTAYKPGEMPGAPMHPHRGFNECPYAKEISGGNTAQYGGMKARYHTGKTGEFQPGAFEWGKVGIGIEHEGVVDPRWTGVMHFFQLWVNLPRVHKLDPPAFQNAHSSALPEVAPGRSIGSWSGDHLGGPLAISQRAESIGEGFGF